MHPPRVAARPCRRGAGHDRAMGLDRLLGKPADKRLAPVATALIASRLISPASKLATARDLAADTASSSLGRLLDLGAGRRDRALRRARLARRAPGRNRERARPPPSEGRRAGDLRPLLVLAGRPVLRVGALRPFADGQKGKRQIGLGSGVRRGKGAACYVKLGQWDRRD